MISRSKIPTPVLLLALLMAMLSCDTASNVEDPDLNYFVKYYGGDGNQYGVDMEMLSDGSFLLLGNSSRSNFDSDIYLVRVKAEGEIIWERRFRQDNSRAKDLEPTADGNFIILADYQSEVAATQFKLLKISSDGVLLDSTTNVGTEANDYSHTVSRLNDGGFIVSGTTELTSTYSLQNSPDPDLGNFFNYRFDQDLNQFSLNDWAPVSPGFGGKYDVAIKTTQPLDSVFYIFGYSNINLSATNPDKKLGLFYFKRNNEGGESDPFFPGNIVNVNDTRIQFVAPVAAQLGGGYIIIGTSQNNVGVSDVFMARLRSSLTFTSIQNDATLYNTIPLGRNIRGVSATSSLTGSPGFLVLGNEVRTTGALNIWLSKIDQSGGVLWSSTFGSENENDTAAAVAELPDGKILILGTMGLADNQYKMALIKVNPNGQLLK